MASCRRRQLITAGRTRLLPARLCECDRYNKIPKFCRDLTLYSRGHALYHDGQWFHVYCFKEARTGKSSWRDLAARSLIRSSAAVAPTGRGRKKVNVSGTVGESDPAASLAPAASEYSPLSAAQKREKPRPGGPGLQSPRGCMARGLGVAPSVFSFDTNSTHAIWPVPRGSGFFSPTASLVQLGRIIPKPNRDGA